MGLASSFKDLVYYHHGGEYGRVQADMVLEEPRVLHLDLKEVKWRLSSAGSQEKALIPHWMELEHRDLACCIWFGQGFHASG